MNIHQAMRYNTIMKGLRGWRIILVAWIFCFCMGVIVYASTNLIENHECTYVFSVVKVLLTCFYYHYANYQLHNRKCSFQNSLEVLFHLWLF